MHVCNNDDGSVVTTRSLDDMQPKIGILSIAYQTNERKKEKKSGLKRKSESIQAVT